MWNARTALGSGIRLATSIQSATKVVYLLAFAAELGVVAHEHFASYL